MFKHILCPIDGSSGSLHALDAAARLASEQLCELTICTVVDPAKASAMAFGDPGMSAACFNALGEEARATVNDAAARVKARISATVVTIDGQPVQSIVDCAKANHCDLIVIGSHGRSGLQRALLGSVAEGVVRLAPCPVMVFRYGVREEAAASAAAPAAAQRS